MFYENKEAPFYIGFLSTAFQFPLHIHQYIEITHVMKGQLEMQIGDKKYVLNEGDITVIFPNVLHDYHTLSSEEDTKLHIINCYLDFLPYHKKILQSEYPVTPVVRKEDVHKDVYYAKKRLLEMTHDDDYVALSSTLCSLILIRLLPYMNLSPFADKIATDISNEIIFYIGKHFTEEITLERVANHFGIGKFKLSRIFSNVLGMNFSGYINLLRINRSQFLLLNTEMSILNIALESGYQNQQSFNRVFKARCDCTPKEYRKKYSDNKVIGDKPLIALE